MLQQRISDLMEAIEVLEDGGHEYAVSVLKSKLREIQAQINDPDAL
ncbi:hypothetical protein [Cohnella cholangitidis]|nr:hypothetical protein [Cohnella cholangitidis]